MSTIIWEVIKKHWCDLMEQEAELLEERVYPGDPIPEGGTAYQVLARKCSHGIECNMAGYYCRWAWTNPEYDPFAEKPAAIQPL